MQARWSCKSFRWSYSPIESVLRHGKKYEQLLYCFIVVTLNLKKSNDFCYDKRDRSRKAEAVEAHRASMRSWYTERWKPRFQRNWKTRSLTPITSIKNIHISDFRDREERREKEYQSKREIYCVWDFDSIIILFVYQSQREREIERER